MLSIDDELNDYISLSKHLKHDTERKKKTLLFEFEQRGEKYLQEIEIKNKNKKLKQSKLIKYILKHRSDIYDKNELMSYSFKDVIDIHNEIKKNNKSKIVKFFQFIFNI